MIESLVIENIKPSETNILEKIDKELENKIKNKEYDIDSIQSKLDNIANLKEDLSEKMDDISFDKEVTNYELIALETMENILNQFIDILQSVGFDIQDIRLDSISELKTKIIGFDAKELLLKADLTKNEIMFLRLKDNLSKSIIQKDSLIESKELVDTKYKQTFTELEVYIKNKNLTSDDIESLNDFTKVTINNLENFNLSQEDIQQFSLQFSKSLAENIVDLKDEFEDFDIDFSKVIDSAKEDAVIGAGIGAAMTVEAGGVGGILGGVVGAATGAVSEITKEYSLYMGASQGFAEGIQIATELLSPIGVEKAGLKLSTEVFKSVKATKVGESTFAKLDDFSNTLVEKIDDVKTYAGDKIKTLEYETKGILNDLKNYDFVDKDGNIIFTGKIRDIVGDRTIKMDYVGSKLNNSNAAGFERNSQKFGQLYLEKYPETLSDINKKLIESGKAPIVDKQWVKYHPEQKPFLGEKLEHHHLNNTDEAVYIPQTLHRGKINKENMHVA